jgi:molecular chaperone DnaK (HSP70)
VSRILNEPTAAALAFGVLDPLSQSNRKESALEDLLNPRSKDAGDKNPSVERAAQVGYGEEVCSTEGDIDAVGAGERGKRADKDAGEETGHGRNMLVFDFGGGTLDVTIMYIEHLTFKVRATDGDMTLGGEDIDATLVGHMLKVFKAKSGIDINEMDNEAKQSKAFKKMRDACAQAKIELSRESESELCIDDLVGGEGFETTLCREDMEEVIQPVLHRLRAPVERALLKVNGGMQARDVDQVFLMHVNWFDIRELHD